MHLKNWVEVWFIVIIIFITSWRRRQKKKKVSNPSIIEIIPIFQPELYWEYKRPTPEISDKVDAFIVNFTNELKALISLEKSIEENYEILAEKIGVNVHPSLAKKPKEVS